MSTNFKTDSDIYVSTDNWDTDDYYACYRWLSRLVSKAPKNLDYAKQLQAVDISRMATELKVFLKLLVSDVPDSREFLTYDDLQELDKLGPLDPPVALNDNPIGITAYEQMGVLL